MATPRVVRRVQVFGLVGLLALTVAGCGADILPRFGAGSGAGSTMPAPDQQWGSAADAPHGRKSEPNRTLPASLRSQFPQTSGSARKRNDAKVEQAPAAQARGFDRATSRELPDSRDEHTRRFANTDGTETTEFSASPLHYRRTDGTWAPIDPALTPDDAGWRTTADSAEVKIAGASDARELVKLSLDAEHSVAYGLEKPATVAAENDGKTVTFPGVWPHADVRLEPRGGGSVKETIVLRHLDAPQAFAFPLHLKGLTARVEGDEVVLTDAAGTLRAVFPAGYMEDAKGARSTGVKYTLDGNTLRVALDRSWLTDPARAFPIEVDPTVGPPVTPGTADSAMYVKGSGSVVGTSDLIVGRHEGANSAAYLKFGGVVTALRNHTVHGAQLQLVNYDSGSCAPRAVSVHPVRESWTAGTGHAYPGPDVDAAVATASFAHGYITSGGQSACPAAGELIPLGAGGRDLVQGWVNGTRPNYGISLRASTVDGAAWKKFTGTATTNPPKLFVTHTPYNATYSIPNPVPDPPVLQNTAGTLKGITLKNLGAETWQPGTYALAYRAYRADTGQSVTQQLAAQLTAPVVRSGRITLNATIKPLPPGRYHIDFTMVKNGNLFFTDHMVPPGRIMLEVYDIPPTFKELHPPNGYQTPTLTPQLWAEGFDIDAPPGSHMRYRFEVCQSDAAGNPVQCFGSGELTGRSWVVPTGKLVWSKHYLWRAFVKDTGTEVPSPYASLLTEVPQPEITSRIAAAPYGSQNQEYDAQVGNFTTAAVDAPVNGVGPQLSVERTYNSLDPRTDSLFGAGWVTRYDMRLRADDDASGNVVVTYPDGQEVRFGRNPDGTYAAPSVRVARLTFDGTWWRLADKAGSTFQFSGDGKLSRITDAAGRATVLTYNPADGKLSKAHSANSQTSQSGRSVAFTWSGGHVSAVTTDTATWAYTYDGDRLTKVCAPGSACTTYGYTAGSRYRSAVLDAKPESYWRFDEPEGTAAASDIAVNLGKDAATYRDVTLDSPGALPDGDSPAASFNGTSSTVELPKGVVKKSRDVSLELWFKSKATGAGGPLAGYQDKALGTAPGRGVPVLYIGTDGKLRGQFASNTITPITTANGLNDDKWHHVVLSATGSTQTMYVDGVKTGTLENQVLDHSSLTFNQIGAAHATGAWPAWGSGQRHFNGVIDEVSLYAKALGPGAALSHFRAGASTQRISQVTWPSGKVAARVAYDLKLGRIAEYTDRNGGTWKIGTPAVYGGDTDLRRSVQVLDPGNRPHLYEYDALAGRLLRLGTPAGLEMREEDRPGDPVSPPQEPVEQCTAPDPGNPQFCTIIPGNAGGPVFVRHPLDGMSIRTFSYDARGFQNVVTNEVGDQVTMTHDERGNVVSRKTCRTKTECHTAYFTFPAAADEFDPRADLVTESRDARSASATDNTYRTTFTYSPAGDLLTQTSPEGGTVKHTYTNGGQAAVGGGISPAGLISTTTDPRGGVVKFEYFQNGDTAKVTAASGMVLGYTYDTLGRKTSETLTADGKPGVATSYTYDVAGRPLTTTGPVTTNSVTKSTHQQRTTNSYDVDGNLVQVKAEDLKSTDPARVATVEYDDRNRQQRTVDAEGNETSFSYDAFGNRTSTVDAAGNRVDYAYTARNQVAQVRLRDWTPAPGEPQTGDYLVLNSYSYDYAGRLASTTDAMGRRVEHEYYGDDLAKRDVLIGLRNPDGSKRDYVLEQQTYDAAGNLTRQVGDNGKSVVDYVVGRSGQVESTTVDPGGLARRSTAAFDLNGNVTRTTRSGQSSGVPWLTPTAPEVADFAYDATGNRTRETISGSGSTRVTNYVYNQRGLLTSATGPAGDISAFEYDELGRQIRETGPTVTAESLGKPAADVTPEELTGYNGFGDQTAVRDALANVHTIRHDKLGRAVGTSAPSYLPPGGATPITPTTSLRYDSTGNVVEAIDEKGSATRYAYDRLGRVVTREEPGRTNDDRAKWAYTYTRTGQVLSVTDPHGGQVRSTYDDLDRQVTTTRVERHPVAANLTTTVTYDDAGNATHVKSPSGAVSANVHDAVGALLKTTDPAGVVTEFGYDGFGRKVRTTDGKGRTARVDHDLFGQVVKESDLAPNGAAIRSQTYGYDVAGNLVSATNPLGRTTTYAYNAAEQLVRQVEPVSATSSITTTFGYDAAGNRTRYTDGRGHSTFYSVNSLGLPESVVEPSTTAHSSAADRTWTVAYNEASEAVRLTAPGGVARSREFDAAGRMTRETGAGASSPTAERTVEHDLLGRAVKVGDNTYRYNDQGMLLAAEGPSGNASYVYGADGELTERTDASGTARFGYTNGRVSTLTDSLTGATQALGYDSAGDVTSVSYGGGLARTFGYDDLGRTTSEDMRNGTNVVSSVAYSYDLDNHLTGKTTTGTAGAAQNTYAYDFAGRLTSWTAGTTTTSYEWDATGNRTRAGAQSSTFDERNRLLSDGSHTYSYTPRGTLASKSGTQFSFDAFDRMVSSGNLNYSYDDSDRLISRNGREFRYAGLSDAVVSDGIELYSRGPADELLAIAEAATKRIAVTDRHGDVVGAVDPTTKALAGSTAFDPFGKVVASAGDKANVGFQGDWTDPDTGQVDMGARWYSPDSGTFASRDSAGYSGGESILANRYTYGAGAPLDFDDPDGHWPKWVKKWKNKVKRAASSVVSFVRSIPDRVSQAWDTARNAWENLKRSATDLWDRYKPDLGNIRDRAVNWGREKAADARKWAQEKRAAAVQKVREVAERVAKSGPVRVIKAALKPYVEITRKVVDVVKDPKAAFDKVVKDVRKQYDAVYKKAKEMTESAISSVSKAADAVGEWVSEHKADIAGFVAGAVVGVACGIAVGWTGVGAVACGALAGVVGSLVHDMVEGGHSGEEMAKNAAVDGLIGGVTGGIGAKLPGLGQAKDVVSGRSAAAWLAARPRLARFAGTVTHSVRKTGKDTAPGGELIDDVDTGRALIYDLTEEYGPDVINWGKRIAYQGKHKAKEPLLYRGKHAAGRYQGKHKRPWSHIGKNRRAQDWQDYMGWEGGAGNVVDAAYGWIKRIQDA